MKKIVTMFVMMMMVLAISCAADDATDGDKGSSGGGKTALKVGDVTIEAGDVKDAIQAAITASLVGTGTSGAGTAGVVTLPTSALVAGPEATAIKLAVTVAAGTTATYSQATFVNALKLALNEASAKYNVSTATPALNAKILTVKATIVGEGNFTVPTDLNTFVIEVTVADAWVQ